MLARKIVLPDSACHKLAVASLLEWYTPAKICIPTYACRSIQSIFLHLMPYTSALLVCHVQHHLFNKLGKKWNLCHQYETLHMRLDHGGFCLSLLSFSSFDWIFIYLTGYILLSQLGPLPHILPLHQKCSTNGTLKSRYQARMICHICITVFTIQSLCSCSCL